MFWDSINCKCPSFDCNVFQYAYTRCKVNRDFTEIQAFSLHFAHFMQTSPMFAICQCKIVILDKKGMLKNIISYIALFCKPFV